MNRLKYMRINAGLSQRQLSELSGVSACYICNAEKRGLVLYEKHAKALSDALKWSGNPNELMNEVEA